MKAYKANWEIQGLKGMVLAPGATVKLEAEEAQQLVDCGALSPCDAEAGNADAEDTQSGTEGQEVSLAEMTKAQLVTYGQEKHGLSLDINQKKDALLEAIAAAAKQ